MKTEVNIDTTYALSDNIVAREIEGELIVIPIVAGIGDIDDDLFTLNEIGKAIWEKLDGERSLKVVVEELSAEFEAQPGEIKEDVIGLVGELLKRRIVVEASNS